MKLNLRNVLPVFFQSGNTSRPRPPFQTPRLPTECTRITLERFQKSSPPPALVPFFPPTDVAGLVRKLIVRVTLTPLMVFLGGDKFFWVPSIIAPSNGPEAGPHRVQKVGSSFKGVEETACYLPTRPTSPEVKLSGATGLQTGGLRPAIHQAPRALDLLLNDHLSPPLLFRP